jgi:hypothetical protein
VREGTEGIAPISVFIGIVTYHCVPVVYAYVVLRREQLLVVVEKGRGADGAWMVPSTADVNRRIDMVSLHFISKKLICTAVTSHVRLERDQHRGGPVESSFARGGLW